MWLLKGGEKVGYHVAAAANEDEIIVTGIRQGLLIGFCYCGEGGAMQGIEFSYGLYLLGGNGTVTAGLCPVIDGILR